MIDFCKHESLNGDEYFFTFLEYSNGEIRKISSPFKKSIEFDQTTQNVLSDFIKSFQDEVKQCLIRGSKYSIEL